MPLISAIRLSTEVLGKEHAFFLRAEVTVEIVEVWKKTPVSSN
jgi:hypothetical protein